MKRKVRQLAKDSRIPRVAVVGCGYWGKNLVRNFLELKALIAICDTDMDRLESFKIKYPGLKTTPSFIEILEDSNIGAVVLATPTVHHFRMAKEALLAGKDVFIEKPLALEVKEGKELVKLAEENKKVLMVGHVLRYHPAVNKLKELVDRGTLGRIQYIYSNRLNIGKIRTQENILWSFAPHDISVILFLLNEFPESIYAGGGSYLQHGIPDVTLTTMHFKSGVRAHIFVSWLHPFKEQKLVVVGDKKMAVFDDTSKERLFLYPHKIEWVERIPMAHKAEAEIVPLEMEEPLKAECRHFLECIQKGQIPKTDGLEGLRVLRVLEASQESLNRNGATIYLIARDVFVHESSYVDQGVEIGSGTRIWYFSHILKGSRIGRDCNIGQNVVIGPNVIIGNGCKIQNNVSVYQGVALEDHVFLGPSMVFTNVINPRSEISRMQELRPTIVKIGATIGANATIICGHNIGCYAFVGAGAVVTRDVPNYALVYGNPAQIRGWMCECGIELSFKGGKARCKTCGKKYRKKANIVERTIS